MLLKRPVFDVLGHLFEYATKVKDFPTQPLADVGTTDLSNFQPTAEFLPWPGIMRPSGSGVPHHIPSYLG